MLPAPFPARPDTVVPGLLVGPFDGQVLDAATGKPIEGAYVLGSWAMEAGDPLRGPGAAAHELVRTDSDGRYQVPALAEIRGRRLARFALIVYRRSYLAYRSDRRFEDLEPRHDFSQTGNRVLLDPIGGDVSHVRHLRFIGAGGPLLPQLESERIEASQELAGAKVRTAEHQPIDASVLLSADELTAATPSQGAFLVEKLSDLPTSDSYDSIHFRAPGQTERFDAALRVWKLPPAAAEQRFLRDLSELPGAHEAMDPQPHVGDRMLFANERDILAITALDRTSGVVVRFTCGLGVCPHEEAATLLMRRIWPRIGRISSGPLHLRAPEMPQ